MNKSFSRPSGFPCFCLVVFLVVPLARSLPVDDESTVHRFKRNINSQTESSSLAKASSSATTSIPLATLIQYLNTMKPLTPPPQGGRGPPGADPNGILNGLLGGLSSTLGGTVGSLSNTVANPLNLGLNTQLTDLFSLISKLFGGLSSITTPLLNGVLSGGGMGSGGMPGMPGMGGMGGMGIKPPPSAGVPASLMSPSIYSFLAQKLTSSASAKAESQGSTVTTN